MMDKLLLPEIFNLTPHINLTYKQNNFIISFAALGHTLADQIVYRYRMTNYEKEWQMIPHSINKAYYSNLPYGNYKFELQSFNRPRIHVDNSGTRNQFLYITTLVADRLGQVTVCSYLPVHFYHYCLSIS